jgi:hypothetical protein
MWQPNTRMCETSGVLPDNNSCAICVFNRVGLSFVIVEF